MDMSISEKHHMSGKLPELLCLQQDFTTDPSVDLKYLLVGFGMLFAHLTAMRLRLHVVAGIAPSIPKPLSIFHGMESCMH